MNTLSSSEGSCSRGQRWQRCSTGGVHLITARAKLRYLATLLHEACGFVPCDLADRTIMASTLIFGYDLVYEDP
eukprot:2001599-Prymnesium_polylepis.1